MYLGACQDYLHIFYMGCNITTYRNEGVGCQCHELGPNRLHQHTRILQTKVSGIPLVLGLGAKPEFQIPMCILYYTVLQYIILSWCLFSPCGPLVCKGGALENGSHLPRSLAVAATDRFQPPGYRAFASSTRVSHANRDCPSLAGPHHELIGPSMYRHSCSRFLLSLGPSWLIGLLTGGVFIRRAKTGRKRALRGVNPDKALVRPFRPE